VVSDLSGFMLIRATYTWDYEYGLPCIVVFVRELFRHQQYHGLIAEMVGPPAPVVGGEFVTSARLAPRRSTRGQRPKDPSVLRM